MSESQAYIKAGGSGAAIAVICCFPPLLVISFGIVGLVAVTGYLDDLFLPALLICLGLLAYGTVLRKKEHAACCEHKSPSEGGRP